MVPVPPSTHPQDIGAGRRHEPAWSALGPSPEASLVEAKTARNARYFGGRWTAGIDPRKWQRRSTHAFRKGFVSGLRKAGVDPDAVEFLVGHTLGIVGVYTAPDSLLLLETVTLVPEVPRHLYAEDARPVADVVELRVGRTPRARTSCARARSKGT